MTHISLRGRTALVTGGSGELGRTIVATLAAAGADVLVAYRSARGQAERAVAAAQAHGVRAVALPVDVSDEESVRALRDDCARKLGEPDLLVLNAVSQYTWRPLLEQPIADFEDQFGTTVRQTVLFAQTFAPAMVARGAGRIIAINTECTIQCLPTQSAYVAGKRGMDGVLRVLARELGPSGVTVNQVAPGWTESERDREGADVARAMSAARYTETLPLRRRPTDQDVANAVLFFASELAASVTGAFLPVAGGNVMVSV